MKTLLKIDCSSRTQGSHSRALGNYFVKTWLEHNQDGKVIERDLSKDSIPSISEATIAGFYTEVDELTSELKQAISLSDSLIDELQSCTDLVIAVPIYNFTVPSALKAWIDQIVRIGHTFSFDGEGFNGLCEVKQVNLICVYGAAGYLEGGQLFSANFLEPYLKFLFGFLGVPSIQVVSLEGASGDPESFEKNKIQSLADIDDLFELEIEEAAL